MFWNLVATFIAGFGAAGIALTIRSLTRKRAPRWLIPVFAGAGMLGYQVYLEYTWFDHKQSQLPAAAEVVSTEQQKIAWRPWSYLAPQVTSFTVLDVDSIRRERGTEGIARFYLHRFERIVMDRVSSQVYLLNCDSRELVPLSAAGTPDVNALRRLDSSDPLQLGVCQRISRAQESEEAS